MKSIRRARVVMVADGDHGQMLAARLARMGVIQVAAVSALDDARRACETGAADACIVVRDDPPLDAAPQADPDAPGRGYGVPSLLVVPAVTPYARIVARRAGYAGAVPANIATRMLYRRVGAALQQRRAVRRRRRLPGNLVPQPPQMAGKPTLH